MKVPRSALASVALNTLIGLACLLPGLFLISIFASGGLERIGLSRDAAVPARIVVFGLPTYGLLAIIGCAGTIARSRDGWRLLLAVDVFGLCALGLASLGAIGFALPLPVLGLAIWAHMTRATREWIERSR
jgi:hypothetical protein